MEEQKPQLSQSEIDKIEADAHLQMMQAAKRIFSKLPQQPSQSEVSRAFLLSMREADAIRSRANNSARPSHVFPRSAVCVASAFISHLLGMDDIPPESVIGHAIVCYASAFAANEMAAWASALIVEGDCFDTSADDGMKLLDDVAGSAS